MERPHKKFNYESRNFNIISPSPPDVYTGGSRHIEDKNKDHSPISHSYGPEKVARVGKR